MSIKTVAPDAKFNQLALEIGLTIQAFTKIAPMSADQIVGALAFCTGSAIASCPKTMSRAELRQMADINIGNGLQAGARSGLIILP